MSAHGRAGPGQRVVIAGGGFAGFHAARTLGRLAKGRLDVVLVNPTDYFLYLPLLPEVAAGILDPRTVAAPLATCRGVRHVLGAVTDIDTDGRHLAVRDPEGNRRTVSYDQLVIALGSVNKLLPIPGVADHAHGFRSLAEAMYLRDHLLRQIEIADLSDDRAERDARCTFVVVGAGYTGTEVAASGQLLTRIAARRRPGLTGQKLRWMLLDVAPRVMPELDPRLSAIASQVLSARGVEVRTGTSVEHASADGVKLSDGEFVPTCSLIWCEDWESLGGPVPGPDGDVRVFSASTLRFEGDASGHVRAVHLVGVEPEQRRPQPGTGRVISADLVLLALGFDGPDHDGGLMEQLALRPDPRGNFARDTDFSAGPEGVFVAGDAGRGASLIVWAIAEGRAAAAAVDRYLMSATTLPAPIEPTDRPLAV
jgi:pyruvate/2-oxoglutarate dehydrogenase complex dihydrolipoamide dehydrogenase (E3) component